MITEKIEEEKDAVPIQTVHVELTCLNEYNETSR